VSNQAASHSLRCARRSNFEQIAWGLGLFEVVANPVAPECPVGDAGDKTFLLSAEGRDLLLQQALVFVVRPDPIHKNPSRTSTQRRGIPFSPSVSNYASRIS
jgi:hypothetical protein